MENVFIKPSFLHKLQQTFQKDVRELIDIYLLDSKKKLQLLGKSLEDQNFASFLTSLQELRYRSVDVGAIQFSHYCLMLEIATHEMQFKKLPQLIHFLESVFVKVQADLEVFREKNI